jgi:DNA-binding IclR family transcriptional regulator
MVTNAPSLLDSLFGSIRLRVLEALYSSPYQAWSVKEIAHVCGVSAATAHRQVKELESHRILVRLRTGAKRLRLNVDHPASAPLATLLRAGQPKN